MALGNIRRVLLFLVVALAGIVGGGVGAYTLCTQRSEVLDQQRVDLARALRASDLQNRLSTLRVLREYNVPKDDISAHEISAVVLLDTIEFENLEYESASRVVLERVSSTLAAYRNDFPDSEFDPARHSRIAKLLSLRSELKR